MAGFEVITHGRFWVIAEDGSYYSFGRRGPGSLPACEVG
jgi:hypothetical protein